MTTTGAIYHYFDSKAELFEAAASQVEEALLTGLRAATEGADTTASKMRRLLDTAVTLGEQDADLARFVAIAPVELERRQEFHSLHMRMLDQVVGFFSDIVEDGKKRGEIAADVDTRAAAELLFAATLGIAIQAGLYADQVSLREVVDAFERLLEGKLFIERAAPPAAGTRKFRNQIARRM